MPRNIGSTNELALVAFVAAKTEIDRPLAEIAALRADHFHAAPDEITWGHVGMATLKRAP